MGAPLLEIHDLQKHFLVKKSFSAQNRVYLKAVDGVDLTMEKGETIGLVGESGCGKSTLGRTILKLHSVTGGQIVYEGKDITKYTPDQMMEYRRKMQLIFQDPFASLNPRKTIMQSVEAPLDLSHDIPKAERRERVIKMLDVVGLGEKYLNKSPHELSGGQGPDQQSRNGRLRRAGFGAGRFGPLPGAQPAQGFAGTDESGLPLYLPRPERRAVHLR